MSDAERVENTGNNGNNGKKKKRKGARSIKLYSYSQMFYYWPVWIISLLLGSALYFMENPPWQEYYGLAFVAILIYTITATSISIRGIWFLLLTALLVIGALVTVMLEIDDDIIKYILELELTANAGFYLTIGSVLAGFWFLTTFIYDKLRYVEISRKQIRLVRTTGDGIKAYDTFGMVMVRQRDNFAQHWVLGFGSADIVINPRAADAVPIFHNNVLCAGRKLKDIEVLLEGNTEG